MTNAQEWTEMPDLSGNGWMSGKSALVTGGGSGIGRAVSAAFAAGGARVFILDRNRETLSDAVEEMSATGGDVVGIPTDISNADEVDRAVTEALGASTGLDILINNAGVLDRMGLLHETADDEWQRVIAVNLTGPFNVTRRAIPALLESRGAIVNIASIAGILGGRAGMTYTVAKHGVIGLTRSTAWMYADRGLRCNAVCPGPVATNIRASETDYSVEGRAHLAPLLTTAIRTGHPDEIAAVATFLASPHAGYVNGAVIVADGGWTVA